MIDDRRAERMRQIRYHAIRWAPVLGLAMLTYLLYPVSQGIDLPILGAGDVAPVDVLAPFDYEVPKTESELAREAEVLDHTIKPFYDLRADVADSLITEARSFFAQLDSIAGLDPDSVSYTGLPLSRTQVRHLIDNNLVDDYSRALTRMIRDLLRRGVAGPGVLESETAPEIVVRGDDGDRIVPWVDAMSWAQYLGRRVDYYPEPDSPLGHGVFARLLNDFFKPTLEPNQAETERSRMDLRASIDSVEFSVQAGERIITAHELVTDGMRRRLMALRSEVLERGGATGGSTRSIVGQISTNALVISIFWLLLTFYRRENYRDVRQVAVFSLIFATVIIGAALTAGLISTGAELIPIPLAGMLVTVLFSGRASLVAVTALSILLGSQTAYAGQDAVYFALVGGIGAAFSVRAIQRRSQLLVAFGLITTGFVLAATTVALRLEWSLTLFGESIARGAANALASAALVTITLPLFELAAGVVTDLTLLELSDPNRPLMRRLATEAAGTYAHSIAMANLCESACNSIGANGLLARVGCYYHDIGKMSKPRFFAENQVGGHNPHDSLSPGASAEIIRNHVTDGIALAEEQKVPPAIVAFIPEHHGTMEISYFLDRARKFNTDKDVNLEQYRYPGPRPQSAETAVTMLADTVEAALRVLDEPTREKMAGAIDHIVKQRIDSGQLDEAPLTLAQIAEVKRSFLRVMAGMYHNRISYPEGSGGIGAQWDAAAST